MKTSFSKNGWEDYTYWSENDKKITKKINKLIKEILRNPFEGTGKPEPLKANLSGLWSRRVTIEHRLVYEIREDELIIHQCKYHY